MTRRKTELSDKEWLRLRQEDVTKIVALLQQGAWSAPQIARELHWHRYRARGALERMEKLGMVRSFIGGLKTKTGWRDSRVYALVVK